MSNINGLICKVSIGTNNFHLSYPAKSLIYTTIKPGLPLATLPSRSLPALKASAMQLRRSGFIFTLITILHSTLTTAITLDCEHARDGGHSFNFKPLGGPHSVGWDREGEDSIKSFTFTLDICQSLGRSRGIPPDEDCPHGSYGEYFCPNI